MLNEYNDLDLECKHDVDPFKRCDPLKTFASPESLEVSMICITAMYVACNLIAWMIMIKLSTKYE